MKLNLDKVDTMYGAFINGDIYKYGWYKSGKAFIAKNGELLNFYQSCRLVDKTRNKWFTGLVGWSDLLLP